MMICFFWVGLVEVILLVGVVWGFLFVLILKGRKGNSRSLATPPQSVRDRGADGKL